MALLESDQWELKEDFSWVFLESLFTMFFGGSNAKIESNDRRDKAME